MDKLDTLQTERKEYHVWRNWVNKLLTTVLVTCGTAGNHQSSDKRCAVFRLSFPVSGHSHGTRMFFKVGVIRRSYNFGQSPFMRVFFSMLLLS